MTEARKVPLLNVANILTMARLALVPVFLFSLFEAGGFDTTWRLIAFGIFAVASFTDHIDGTLARKHGLKISFRPSARGGKPTKSTSVDGSPSTLTMKSRYFNRLLTIRIV